MRIDGNAWELRKAIALELYELTDPCDGKRNVFGG
jgi:hypothetical protein